MMRLSLWLPYLPEEGISPMPRHDYHIVNPFRQPRFNGYHPFRSHSGYGLSQRATLFARSGHHARRCDNGLQHVIPFLDPLLAALGVGFLSWLPYLPTQDILVRHADRRASSFTSE